ncbi:MAG: cytochrome c [Bacteroidia bacterium]|nr:cytochrome c [Bacteroidia bacterium]
MKKIKFIILSAGVILLSACTKKDPNSPGFEYMPDMYRAVGLEYYHAIEVDGDTIWGAQLPPKNTIARGYKPYPYPNTPEGYELAGQNLKNPLENSEENIKKGEELYTKYCIHCHGASGQGDGKVAGKLPGPPPPYTSAAILNLPEGKMFHSITYGKGLMGSHNFLSVNERWALILYIHKLQGKDKTETKQDSTASKLTAKK